DRLARHRDRRLAAAREEAAGAPPLRLSETTHVGARHARDRTYGIARMAGSCVLALRNVHGEAAARGLLVDGRHVEAGLAHRGDHLVERYLVRAVTLQREPRRVDRLHRAHGVALDAR